MMEQPKEENVTGPGAIGGPRPGEEGIKRVPSPSSSDVRREEQVPDQACFSLRASDLKKDVTRKEAAESEDSVSDDPAPMTRGRAKRRKRITPVITPSMSEAEMPSDTGNETQQESKDPQIPPPSKASKRLPTVDERVAAIRHMPSATLADSIFEAADSIEQVAVTSGNLKGTYMRRLKDDAGKVRAGAIELAKRTNTTAAMAELEQENIRLRARLQKADLEIECLKLQQQQERRDMERDRPMEPPTAKKVKPAADPMRKELVDSDAKKEIRALTEQVQALKELVVAMMKEDRPTGQNTLTRREPANSVPERPPNVRGGQSNGRDHAVQKNAREQREAEPTARPMPAAAVDPTTTWVKVVGRKEKAAKKKAEKATIRKETASRDEREKGQRPTPKGTRMRGKPKVNPPRRAAVAISLAPGSTKTSGEVLATARAKIRLTELGVPVAKIRQTMTGGMLIEIPGQESSAKADGLAAKLKEVFAEESEVRISRPSKRAEIRICGLDASIQPSEVKERVAAEGGCSEEDVKIGEIRTRSPRGLGAVWVQCPALAAQALADKGRIVIGWVHARVEVLEARPLTCFRCFQKGHTAGSCTSMKDRSSDCYNCGERGHRARECRSPPKCPVCSDAGMTSSHRFGGRACNPPVPRKAREKKETATRVASPTKKRVTRTQATNKDQERGPEEAMEAKVGWPSRAV